MLRSRAKHAKQDTAGALVDRNAALDLDGGARALLARGLVRLAMGQNTEAPQDFDESLELDPGIRYDLPMGSEAARARGPTK